MLQQTQVDTVIPYYGRFLARFPDIATLASAPADDVLALWSGLGYYARARNLHKAAREVMTCHGGRFPGTAAVIAELPGIGRSTAAAIAAFAFGEKAAILDGNVKRVLCRAFGIEGFPGTTAVESQLWALAESLLPREGIERYIQAQMDLGATLCTRGRPACARCPVADVCVALKTDRVETLPTPRPAKHIPQRHARLAVILAGGQVLMERRPPTGIWGGLLSLPEIPDSAADPCSWVESRFSLEAIESAPLAPLRHAFTHFRLDMQPTLIRVRSGRGVSENVGHAWVAMNEVEEAGLPAPIRRILAALGESE